MTRQDNQAPVTMAISPTLIMKYFLESMHAMIHTPYI